MLLLPWARKSMGAEILARSPIEVYRRTDRWEPTLESGLMSIPEPRIPTVLCFSGLDPTGGAGLQADIEAIVSTGGHPLPIATSLTVQDTRDVKALTPCDARQVAAQARAVLADIPVAAVKIGLLGSLGIVEFLHTLLADCEGIPVVLDPILRAGGGTALADGDLIGAMTARLVPRTTVLTPNAREVLRIAPGAPTVDAAAEQIVASGCEYVLVTGADEATPRVVNRLYGRHGLVESFEWPRVEGMFHGSGCTLAAAVAGGLACGLAPREAVAEAEQFTHDAIANGFRIGTGQLVPNRLHQVRKYGAAAH